MIDNLLDPVVLCFILGMLAGILKSDLRLPDALYETLSIYLLLAIGLKGGMELSKSDIATVVVPVIGTLFLGVIIPVIAYPVLRFIGKLNISNSAAIAAHYGSVSAVTFAVVLSYLTRFDIYYEEFTTVLLVVMEVPAIIVGILIAKTFDNNKKSSLNKVLKEIVFGKSIFLLLGGLLVGYLSGYERLQTISPLFVGLFKGALAFFLLEMGIVASRRLKDLKSTGLFLGFFGILMPLFGGTLASFIGLLTGLTPGGTTVLATLAASSSYIAAPAAVRIAIPKANPTLYLTASLGITFPFNIVFGIPVYHSIAVFLHSL